MTASPLDFTIVPARDGDAARLAGLRVVAMRPSLEAVGRFDPMRARERFLSTFVASDTWVLQIAGRCAGFYVLRDRGDHLYLDHLYVAPDQQSSGVGTRVIEAVQARARAKSVPIKLVALVGGRAGAFYARHGFEWVRTEDVDEHYIWRGSAHRGRPHLRNRIETKRLFAGLVGLLRYDIWHGLHC